LFVTEVPKISFAKAGEIVTISENGGIISHLGSCIKNFTVDAKVIA
jgi:hypothetical protein